MYSKCGHVYEKAFKEKELIEILNTLGLINNIEEYQKKTWNQEFWLKIKVKQEIIKQKKMNWWVERTKKIVPKTLNNVVQLLIIVNTFLF